MACAPEHPLCLVIGDYRRLQLTRRAKSTLEGISMAGSTFDFKLSERLSDGKSSTNIFSWTSGANPTKFDVTDIANGVVALLLLSADTATLKSTKTYIGQLRQITGGENFTLCFFAITAKARP